MRPRTLPSLILMAVLLAPVTAIGEDESHAVQFHPGKAGSKLAPRYSPKGYRIPLAPMEKGLEEGRDHREGRLRVGPQHTQGDGHLIVLARSVEGQAFDLLWIDTDADGSLADEDVQRVKPRTSRGNVYTSYAAEVRVNHGSQEEPRWEPYVISLWVAVPSVNTLPEFIRYSRRGFLVGSVTLSETAYRIVLSDANNDASFGEGDWWALLAADEDGANNIGDARKVGDFAWAGREAYKLELEGTRGREGRIVPFDPGLTPEEDARKRDRYWDDKHAARAETPLSFSHEVDDAIQRARSGGAHYFLDFETVWCGPCKQMDRWVYTAHDVVAAAKGIVCIKVDGDERKDLKEQHEVSGFPTGILFSPEGKEVARFSGYRSVKQMTAFLGRVRKVASAEEMAELRRAWDASDALERECAPRPGTKREDVETRFGEGRPTRNQKGRPDGPADSPWRAYVLKLPAAESRPSSASLNVHYDADWKVVRASFGNPFSVKGDLPYEHPLPRSVFEERLRASRRQFEHLRRVREELRRRFGD